MRDHVKPSVHAEVIVRDGACILSFLEPGHVCRDLFGDVHDSRDVGKCTLEHVKDDLRMGKRAPSDAAHMVLLCYAANLRPPTKEQRALFREYLRSGCAHVDRRWDCAACQRRAVAV